MRMLVLGLVMLGLAVPADAAEDRVGTDAKRELQRRINVDPDDQVALAQLAHLYLKAGRPEKARPLYRGLMSLENVALEREGGDPVWSHALARRALKTLDTPVRLGSR